MLKVLKFNKENSIKALRFFLDKRKFIQKNQTSIVSQIIKNVKKHINVKIDNKLNSSDSLCIKSFKPFIIFFKNINTS